VIIDWTYPALTLTGVVAGFVDAVAGGGGLITVPALIYAGLPPAMVLGTNKAQAPAARRWRHGAITARGCSNCARLCPPWARCLSAR
jgi:uncharacterized membrane protein YfcA